MLLGLTLSLLLAAEPLPKTAEQLGYEQQLIEWALREVDRELDPSPEGKRIEEVLVASEEVFSKTDPWPDLLNIFHAKSKDYVVRREVLLGEGDVWSQERVIEIERNLRNRFVFAVARVVAVRSKNGGIGLLVVTKDRWSLRLNSEFNLVGSLLQYLRLQPSEANFLGRSQSAALDFILRLDTMAIGETFVEPRLFDSRVRFAENASIVLNRQTGRPEGTSGYVQVNRPYYSLAQTWGFNAYVEWNVRRARVFRGASIWQLDYPSADAPTSTVPFVYDYRRFNGEGTVSRRFGSSFLTTVSGGVFGYGTSAAPPGESGLSTEQAQWLVSNYLPRTESATGLVARINAFESRFVVLRNVDTLELSEDYQLGLLLDGGVRWAVPVPFTSTAYLEAAAMGRYRWLAADNVLTVQAAVFARFVTGGLPYNRRYTFEVKEVSPQFEGGRFVARVICDVRQNDLNNPQTLLGGGNGLRGAAPEAFAGRNYLLGNFEYRTRAFELLTNYVGFVLFYDVGSAFNDTPVLTHTAGIGLRILLPQFNSEVIRIDFGMVIGGEIPSLSRLNATFSQVTDLRPGFLDGPI